MAILFPRFSFCDFSSHWNLSSLGWLHMNFNFGGFPFPNGKVNKQLKNQVHGQIQLSLGNRPWDRSPSKKETAVWGRAKKISVLERSLLSHRVVRRVSTGNVIKRYSSSLRYYKDCVTLDCYGSTTVTLSHDQCKFTIFSRSFAVTAACCIGKTVVPLLEYEWKKHRRRQ